jgi:hypothetical protein
MRKASCQPCLTRTFTSAVAAGASWILSPEATFTPSALRQTNAAELERGERESGSNLPDGSGRFIVRTAATATASVSLSSPWNARVKLHKNPRRDGRQPDGHDPRIGIRMLTAIRNRVAVGITVSRKRTLYFQ